MALDKAVLERIKQEMVDLENYAKQHHVPLIAVLQKSYTKDANGGGALVKYNSLENVYSGIVDPQLPSAWKVVSETNIVPSNNPKSISVSESNNTVYSRLIKISNDCVQNNIPFIAVTQNQSGFNNYFGTNAQFVKTDARINQMSQNFKVPTPNPKIWNDSDVIYGYGQSVVAPPVAVKPSQAAATNSPVNTGTAKQSVTIDYDLLKKVAGPQPVEAPKVSIPIKQNNDYWAVKKEAPLPQQVAAPAVAPIPKKQVAVPPIQAEPDGTEDENEDDDNDDEEVLRLEAIDEIRESLKELDNFCTETGIAFVGALQKGESSLIKYSTINSSAGPANPTDYRMLDAYDVLFDRPLEANRKYDVLTSDFNQAKEILSEISRECIEKRLPFVGAVQQKDGKIFRTNSYKSLEEDEVDVRLFDVWENLSQDPNVSHKSNFNADKEIPNNVAKPEKTTMEKPTASLVQRTLATVKTEGTEAIWRTAAAQTLTVVQAPLIAALKRQGVSEGVLGFVGIFLETEMGRGLLALLLGTALSNIPNFGNNPKVQRLASELRIMGMASYGNLIAGVVIDPLREMMVNVISGLPEEQAAPIAESSDEEEAATSHKTNSIGTGARF